MTFYALGEVCCSEEPAVLCGQWLGTAEPAVRLGSEQPSDCVANSPSTDLYLQSIYQVYAHMYGFSRLAVI